MNQVGKPMKILLIEDNQSNADIFIRMLNHHGYMDIVHTICGLDGLYAAKDAQYDLILIDFDLPDIHGSQVGLALVTMMRRNAIKAAPLVALTAQSDKTTQMKAEKLGFDGFLGKPCLESDLIDIVSQVTRSI
jgi:CheY-like chemotaxis protein